MADHKIAPVGYQPIVAMNNIGQVVGIDYVGGTVGATPGVTPRKIFVGDLASDGQVTNKHYVDTPYKNVDVFGINDSGQILGSFDDEDGTGTHFFHTKNGEFTRLPLAYTNQTSFFNGQRTINNAGQIAGGQYLFNPDGDVVTLSDPNAAAEPIGDTEIIGLNNDGIVLGSYRQQGDVGYQKKFFTYDSSTSVYTDLPADLQPEAINTSGVFGAVRGGGYVFEGFDGSRVASDYLPADGKNTPITLLSDWVYFNTGKGYVLTSDGFHDTVRISTGDSTHGPYWEIPVDPSDYGLYGLHPDEAHIVAINDKGQILAQIDHPTAADGATSYKKVSVESFDILETTTLPSRGGSSTPKTPVIQGTQGGQTTTDEAPLRPFAHVTVGDPNVGATDTLTITLRDGGGALADGPGQSGLTQTAPGTYRLQAGTPAQLTDELQALVFTPTAGAGGPGATSTTLFELLLASSAGPTAGDRTTTVYDTVRNGAGTAGGPAGGGSPGGGSGSSGGGGSSGTGGAGPLGGGSSGGGASVGGGSSSPGLTPPTNNTANPPGPTAVSEPTTITTTGISGEPYVTSVDRYDSGIYQGSTLLNPNGKVYLESSAVLGSDGSSTHTYTGGSFFRRKAYSSFADSYAADGTLTQHAETNRDATHTIEVFADGQTVQGLGADIVTDYAASTRFVFGPGLGAETIHGFNAAGRGHDTLDLGSDAGKLAQILAHATGNGQGDTTLHLGHGDTITLTGVGVAELKHHKGDFAFHA